MNDPRIVRHGSGLAALFCGLLPSWSPAQAPTPPVLQPPAAVAPAPSSPAALPVPSAPVQPVTDDRATRPASEGPTHEAILSPMKDREPIYVEKAPPAAINERPGDAPTGKNAVSIPGYWEWNPETKDYAWVAGTWRVPPPGRFWANGYWRREARGWYRVPGFWSDRQVDQIDWRKQGPPANQPEDEPGPAPGDGRFYIPGRYVPDGDGVTWKKGFWTKVQPGWVWVPAQWVRQPEGWTVQEGFWDRPLEERGPRFAQVKAGDPGREGDTIYQPRSQATQGQSAQNYGSAARITFSRGGYFSPSYDPSSRSAGMAGPGNGGQIGNPYAAPSGYLNQLQPIVNNNNPGYASDPSSGSGFGGYPYYGHGLGSSPGYYGGSSYGFGIGYYPGYYGGSGSQLGRQGIQQGGLGGYPYYGHGLGYYPGYFGP
jgi:WXXGXW repeat (2 copies)